MTLRAIHFAATSANPRRTRAAPFADGAAIRAWRGDLSEPDPEEEQLGPVEASSIENEPPRRQEEDAKAPDF